MIIVMHYKLLRDYFIHFELSKSILFFSILNIHFVTAFASPDTLTLPNCQLLATTNNPRALLSSNAVVGADLARQEAKAQRLPQIKFRGALEYSPTLGKFGYDPSLTNGGQIGSQLVAEQVLYDGGQKILKSKQMDLEWHRTKQDQILNALDLELDVSQSFTEVRRLQAELSLKKESLLRLQEYLVLVERMHLGGQVGYTDVLKTRIHVSESQSSVNQTELDLQSARYTLLDLVGMNLQSEIWVQDSGNTKETVPQFDSTQNAEWQLAKLGKERAEFDLMLLKNSWKPSLSVAADAGLLTSMDNLKVAQADRNNVFGGSIGVHLDIPLFSFGLKEIQIQEKQLAIVNIKWQWQSRQRNLWIEYQKVQMQWKITRDHLDTLKLTLMVVKDNFRLTKSKYAGGTGSASEVIEAHSLWVETEAALLGAEADLRNLSSKLKRLVAH